MPFLAKCRPCGFLVWALSQEGIDFKRTSHDKKSHRNPRSWEWGYRSWVLTVIERKAYDMLGRVSKTQSFWNVIRRPN